MLFMLAGFSPLSDVIVKSILYHPVHSLLHGESDVNYYDIGELNAKSVSINFAITFV